MGEAKGWCGVVEQSRECGADTQVQSSETNELAR